MLIPPAAYFSRLYEGKPRAEGLRLTLGSDPLAYLLTMQDDSDGQGRFMFLDWCLLAGIMVAMGLALALLALVVA
jgi:hypothetical protein